GPACAVFADRAACLRRAGPAARSRGGRGRHRLPAAARLGRANGRRRGGERSVTEGLRRRFQARRLDSPRSPARFGAHYDPDAFGRFSEGIARFFGTARYVVFRPILVVSWITIGWLYFGFDDHPSLFLLN